MALGHPGRRPPSRCRRQRQVFRFGFPPQLPEQHWEFCVHDAPGWLQVAHDGLAAQPGSLQSVSPSQSSSTPPEQTSAAFGRTFGFASLQSPCDGQKPSWSASVHAGQSRPQIGVVSSPLQTPSPQQTVNAWVVQAPHFEGSQPTGFEPPKPQQKRPAGLPP
jgi:hypothetical protein